MSKTRKKKAARIRPLALCVIRRGETILVSEHYDDVKQQRFFRLMGGGIEFDEYGPQAVARELLEEIHEEITDIRYLGTLENIFVYNGEPGHEICLIYYAVFVNETVYTRELIEGRDDHDALITARWMPLDFFRRGQAPLYPDG